MSHPRGGKVRVVDDNAQRRYPSRDRTATESSLMSTPISKNFGGLLDFCFGAFGCALALKFIPAPGGVIILAAERVRVHIHRRSD
jgi:hypothetical protein